MSRNSKRGSTVVIAVLIILILLMIPVTILCARILWKLGIVKVLPNPSAVSADKAEEK